MLRNKLDLKIDSKGLRSSLVVFARKTPIIIASLLVLVFIVLTFFCLIVTRDNQVYGKGQEEVAAVKAISFNKKVLQALENTKESTQFKVSGGRDPFKGF